jgi:predicted GIY-YIG superfamily endonuclease
METLYRFFDKDGQLLYVGISNSWTQRLKQHYKDSDFFEKATFITLRHYESRHEVEAAEKIAIQTEGAIYNKAFNPNYEDTQTHFQKIKQWVYTRTAPDKQHEGMVRELKDFFETDPHWIYKKAAPIAYYLLEFLPDWDEQYEMGCPYCVNLWHSNQIQIWSDYYEGKIVNAAN